MLVGFAFKVAAVPFHMWTPDVYQGAPTPVTGFMAAVAKAGAFAALLRVLASAFVTQRDLAAHHLRRWRCSRWCSARSWRCAARRQADAGVLVDQPRRLHPARPVGRVAAGHVGGPVLPRRLHVPGRRLVRHRDGRSADGRDDLTSYRGLAASRPWLACSLAVLLLAQAGVPFTTGFLAKLAVIESAIEQMGGPGVVLGVIAMLATAISGYFYLRVVVLTYAAPTTLDAPAVASVTPAVARPAARLTAVGSGILLEDRRDGGQADKGAGDGAPREPDAAPVPLATVVAIAACVVPTIVLGIWAGPLVDLTTRATMLFNP